MAILNQDSARLGHACKVSSPFKAIMAEWHSVQWLIDQVRQIAQTDTKFAPLPTAEGLCAHSPGHLDVRHQLC